MLPRSFALVGKAWKRSAIMFVQEASTSRRRRRIMPPQRRHLHHRPSQPMKFSEEQHELRNNIGDTAEGSFDQKFATLKSIGEGRVNDRELELLLKKKPAPICCVWFDPSPWMHISQGIIKTICVNKMVKSGCKVKILMADWFARINRKIGGNLNKMQTIGLYNIEMWKASGMALDRVELVWLSDEISRHADEYWPLAMDVARNTTVSRIKRGCGSKDPLEEFTAADIFYPCLQCATILSQKVDIWLLGMDQHDGNLLAREYCKRVRRGNEPIAVSHNKLPNLLQYPEEEHRRNPSLAIYMEDNEVAISRKIEFAFCPQKLVEGNPCLEYIKYIILPWFGKFEVLRKKEDGGDKTFLNMEELTADYVNGAVQPDDVRLALAKSLNKILQSVRAHFRNSAEAKNAVKGIKEYYRAR